MWDDKAGTETLIADGTATLEWPEHRYAPSGLDIGGRIDFTRQPGPHRDAPYAVAFPAYLETIEEVKLPPGNFTMLNGGDVDQTVAGVAYHRRARIADGSFRAEMNERSLAPEFPAADAPAAQAQLRAMRGKTLYLVLPPGTDRATAPTSKP